MVNFKKTFNENSIGMIILAIVGFYILYLLFKYLNAKGNGGMEMLNMNTNPAYANNVQSASNNNERVKPSEPLGQNEVFASAEGISTTMQGIPPSCNKANITNPAELLPKDNNSEWAQLNPSGQGMMANINLLKAGYHIGIDSVGQTLKNSNLQIRSEPPNPQLNVGPWNQSTISPDFLRVPLEIGSCVQ
jgi:hypothetical protein